MTRPAVALVLAAVLLAPLPAPAAGPPAARGTCSSGQVSLTFDDGPSTTSTPRLLGVLAKAGVPATFFMVGTRVDAAPRVAQQVAAAGHLVANHSWAHQRMTSQTSEQVRATLRATDRRLRQAGLVPTGLVRPPYGAVDDRVRAAIRSTGGVTTMWDVDSRDWTGLSAQAIASRVLAGLRPGRSNVVLQHDGVGNSPASVDAVPRIVAEARRRGYCFVALDEQGRPGFPTPRASLTLRTPRRGAAEGRPAAAVVTLDRPTARATTLRLRLHAGSAEPGVDVQRPPALVTVPAGVQQVRVPLAILRDRLDEPTERIEVRLDRPAGLVLGPHRVTMAIRDRDPAPRLTAIDAEVTASETDPVVVEVRLRLAVPSARRVRVQVATVLLSAGPDDLEEVSRTVRLAPGQRTVVVPVTVLPGPPEEEVETFLLRLSGARNVRLARPDALVTIHPPAPEPAPEEPPAPTPRR